MNKKGIFSKMPSDDIPESGLLKKFQESMLTRPAITVAALFALVLCTFMSCAEAYFIFTHAPIAPKLATKPPAIVQPNPVNPDPDPEAQPDPDPDPDPDPEARQVQPEIPFQPLTVSSQGFGQNKDQVGYGFMVDNPNPDLAITDTQYQVAAYDDKGTVLKTTDGMIDTILPGQKLGKGGVMNLDQDQKAAKIEVAINKGRAEKTDVTSPFTTSKTTYLGNQSFPQVTTMITNNLNQELTDIPITALLYDQAGEIIGGGNSYINFLPAKTSSGVAINVTSAGKVEKVELYPAMPDLIMLSLTGATPSDFQPVKILKQGFGQKDNSIFYGVVVQNPDSNYALEISMYRMTFYAEDGTVVAAIENSINTLLPGETLGVASYVGVDKSLKAVRSEVILKARNYTITQVKSPFTVGNITYVDDPNLPKVTAEISSSFAKDLSNAQAFAILYNDAGEIIGSGMTYIQFIPANGKVAVEIDAFGSGKPAKVEVYAMVSQVSDLQ